MAEDQVLTPNFGNWEVQEDGTLLYHGTEIGIKEIPANGLEYENLPQMLGKFRGGKSEDAASFFFAYLEALKKAGYQSLTIDLNHIHNIKFEKQ